MDMIQISPNVFAAGQITEGEVAELADAGFTDLVCHRPDEEHPEGPVTAKIARMARTCGLNLHYFPIVPGEPFTEQAKGLAKVAAKSGSKVLAYCRSGGRAANAWHLTQSELA